MTKSQSNVMVPITSPQEQGAYCELALPFPQSKVFSLDQLSIQSLSTEQKVQAVCQVIALWSDNSIKWAKFIYVPLNDTQLALNIAPHEAQQQNQQVSQFTPLGRQFSYPNSQEQGLKLALDLDAQQLNIVNQQALQVLSFGANDIKLTNQFNHPIAAHFTHASVMPLVSLAANQTDAIALQITGKFLHTQVEFSLQLDWLVPFDLIKFDMQIHNTNRAIHQGGKWDLGDAGSYYFHELNIEFNTASDSQAQLTNVLLDLNNQTRIEGQHFECQQYASGGENWQSPVHVNQNNQVELEQNGFEIKVDGFDNNTQAISGLRCEPVVQLKSNIALRFDKFWQNFPKSLKVHNQLAVWGLFPARTYQYELQGGEKKTHSMMLSLDSSQQGLTESNLVSRASVDWQWLNQCHLYPFIQTNPAQSCALQPIINLGLEQNHGFVAKREALDEYGWRNFGELYADHETAGYSGKDIFVSHYNNQYDPIYGFLRQYLLSGDTQWFTLADDLAKHVKDIDIYHTQLDKNEYNGGLFWHTDHYLQAYTSSHRSYSKHQSSNAYQDHAGGGGPGGQHCYTTGLYLHYCLTGQLSSKQAVLTLTNWITHVYEGSGTCLELLLAFKNRNVPGIKNHFTGQYPLDRGIANYINALLDSYALTQSQHYLAQAEHILRHTLHPNEDVSLRNLDNVEGTWFYTVLLQALCRYLQVKEQQQAFDQDFYYCRDSLLNYADWMLEHEYPYLEKPDILEYPNETWTAQDLRKTHVLAAAEYYSPEKKNHYMQKAEFFQQYVADKLSQAPTKTYTRILVLLMQNQGAIDSFKLTTTNTNLAPRKTWPPASYQQQTERQGLVKLLTARIRKLSPKAEIDWIKRRLN
ncbi:hypothetical protein [Paraglaciecola aestuariivivens]